MKIDKYEKINKNMYRIYFENGEIIDTYEEIILKFNLLIKKELQTKEYPSVISLTNIYEKYYKTLKYIAIRVRSKKEVKDYLKKNNTEDEDIEYIIKLLEKNNYLNDKIYTELFIKDKLNFTNWGYYKIINSLRNNDIDNNIINEYLKLLDYSIMYDRLYSLIEKYLKINKIKDKYKFKNKLYNHFMTLGYESNMILEIYNELV